MFERGDGLRGVEVCRRRDDDQVEFFRREQRLAAGVARCAESGVRFVQTRLQRIDDGDEVEARMLCHLRRVKLPSNAAQADHGGAQYFVCHSVLLNEHRFRLKNYASSNPNARSRRLTKRFCPTTT